MPRLDDLLIGFGSGALDAYTTRKVEERKMAMELAQAKALLQEKERLTNLYDPERLVANRLLNIARVAGQVPRPEGGYNVMEREADIPEQVAGAAQERELSVLRHLLPRQAMGTSVFFADPFSQTVSPGPQLPPGSRVIPTRQTLEEAEEVSERRAVGGARGRQKVKYEDLTKQFKFISQDVDSVFDFLKKVPAGRAAGPGAVAGAVVGMEGSENTLEYIRTKDLILSKIAKTFGGEVGVLTEGDIKRISRGFPALWMNERERRAAIKWVKDYIQRRIDAYATTTGELEPSSTQEPSDSNDPLGLF